MLTWTRVFGFLKSGIFIGIVAHGLIGVSLVWDKILLRRPDTRNLVSYVFWMGSLSLFGLALIPFGFRMPSLELAALAFVSGALHQAATYYYYAALKNGAASQTLAIMGGFSPVATALIAIPLLSKPLGRDLVGFALMVAGGFVMFFAESFNLRKVLPPVLAASGSFGLVNVLQKVVFDRTNFVSGYVFFTLGTFAASLFLLARKSWRNQIFAASERAEPRSRFWYMVNRFMAGLGSFLIFLAISMANPAVVDAIAGERYAIIFISTYAIAKLRPFWLKENFTGRVLIGKTIATALVVAGLVLLGLHPGEDLVTGNEVLLVSSGLFSGFTE